MIAKQSIRIECFSRGAPINGTKVSSKRSAPRWSRFTVKTAEDVQAAIGKLSESYKRIKEAIKAGEPTGYFFGGEPTTMTESHQEEELEQEAVNGKLEEKK
jgi:hypothetical protein